MTAMTTERRPYDAKHVIIKDNGRSVWVLWTDDPTQTAETIDVMDASVEVVRTMRRVYKQDGHTHGGWLLSDSRGGEDLAATNKRDAMRILRQSVAEYFAR